MFTQRKSRCWILGNLVFSIFVCASAKGQEQTSSGPDMGAAELARLLKSARKELQAVSLSEKEIELRLKIVQNAATVKSYYPHANGGRPETRNSKYWAQNDDGSYVPRDPATDAIKDLWRTPSAIRCRKLAALVMIKAIIDVSDSKQLAQLDDLLSDKVIPNDLGNDGVGTLFEQTRPKQRGVVPNDELLAGDEVWFDNPYFERLSGRQQSKYRGQEGHHVFYVGGGQVMDMYNREPMNIEDFRHTFLKWASVKTVAEDEGRSPKADEFQIKALRRVIVNRDRRIEAALAR
jgi:hypothetical protein